MPKPRGCQLSGAKKRQLAKQKSEKAKSEIASAPRLDRYLVHSTAKSDCESENVATSTSSEPSVRDDDTDIESSNSEVGQLPQCQSQMQSAPEHGKIN